MAKKRILIVEDDRALQELLVDMMQEAGYEASSAMDAIQGTLAARKSHPDLLILDINVPAGGGATVYERLMSLKGVFSGAVLVYSALPKDQVRSRLPDLKDGQILTKPASREQILAAVAALL